MPIGESFEDVLAAARTGAEWAWRVVYKDLAPTVVGYLRARGAPDPEDLAGEVFLQVVRGLDGFTGDEAGFRSWVFVIAHHRLLDDARARNRRPLEVVPSEAFVHMPGTEQVEDEALGGMSMHELRAMIDKLSPDQREVLLLRFLGGLSVEEAAKATGKRPGAVKALQHRGVRALERMFAERGVTP